MQTGANAHAIRTWHLLLVLLLLFAGLASACERRVQAQTVPIPQPTPDKTMDAVVRGRVTIVRATPIPTAAPPAPTPAVAPLAVTPGPRDAVPSTAVRTPTLAPISGTLVDSSAPIKPTATIRRADVEARPEGAGQLPAATANSAPVVKPSATTAQITAPGAGALAITPAAIPGR